MISISEPGKPGAPPTGSKSWLAFFGVLLALFPAALLAQHASRIAGLAMTQLAAFLVPALVATAGSNLRLVPFLRLRAPRRTLTLLGLLVGCASYVFAGAVMTSTQRLMPNRWVEAYDLARMFEGSALERAALALVAVLLAPICEEIAFRGYLQTTLALGRRPAVAVGGGALLFAVLHLDPVRFPALIVLGLVFGWITWRSGSVWPAVAAHSANNGLAAALMIAVRRQDALPDKVAIASALALGGVALALLLRAFRAASGPPPDYADALVLRDPSSPSIRFEPGRVPRALVVAAIAGALGLAALAAFGLARDARRPSDVSTAGEVRAGMARSAPEVDPCHA